MAIAPIQGSGDECRSCRTSCIDRGMAYPCDFAAGTTTRSVTVPAQPVGRWWDRIKQLTQWLSAQWDAHRQNSQLMAASDYHSGPARRYHVPPAVQRDRIAGRTMLRIAGRTPRSGRRESALDERLLD